MLLQHNVPTPGWPEKWLNFLGTHVVQRNVPVYLLLSVCWWVTEKKQRNATLSTFMLPKVHRQIALGKRSLTKKDFSTIVTLLHGDMETSSVVMKDNIGCGGQTVCHVMCDWKQNITYKAVDGLPKTKPPPGTYDCELWLDNAQKTRKCVRLHFWKIIHECCSMS
jgi:hypothetical protein